MDIVLPSSRSVVENASRISSSLSSKLSLSVTPGLNGFCMTCGASCGSSPKECRGCGAVQYCSEACRRADEGDDFEADDFDGDGDEPKGKHSSNNKKAKSKKGGKEAKPDSDDEEGEEGGGGVGHTPGVCRTLSQVVVDDLTYQSMFDRPSSSSSSSASSSPPSDRASVNRVASELESYPATLSGYLLTNGLFASRLSPEGFSDGGEEDGPEQSKARKQRRPKPSRTLQVHVVGSELGSEVWLPPSSGYSAGSSSTLASWSAAYASAFADVVSQYNLKSLTLSFIGRDVDIQALREDVKSFEQQHRKAVRRPDSEVEDPAVAATYMEGGGASSDFVTFRLSPSLVATFVRAPRGYDALLEELRGGGRGAKGGAGETCLAGSAFDVKPDVVAFFNPGFTCEEYGWDKALARVVRSYGEGVEVPFLVTTNTFMEGVQELDMLEGLKGVEAPKADDVMDGQDGDDDESGEQPFFERNLWAGERVRQSGVLGNDLYVKNMWVYGGIIKGGNSKKEKVEHAAAAGGIKKSEKSKRKEEKPEKEPEKKRANKGLI